METFEAPRRTRVVFSGDERTQLESWLDFYRGTVLKKCDGLTPTQLRVRPIATSSLSLLGIVRHMTFVEQAWFESCFAGVDVVEYYRREGERDVDFLELDGVAVEVAVELYLHSIATSRALVAGHDLDEMAATAGRAGGGPALDLPPPHRGVRATLRTRRSPARTARRDHRVLTPLAAIPAPVRDATNQWGGRRP